MKVLVRSHWLLVFLLLATLPTSTACSSPQEVETTDRAHDEPGEREEQEGEDHDDGEYHDEGSIELTAAKAAEFEITTATAESRLFPEVLETTGQVDFDQNRLAHVSPRIPGRVQEVSADLGESVRPGQVLAQLDSIELGRAKAEYLQSKAREDLARQNLEREEKLYADRISSEREKLAARAAHLEAVAALRNAEETLHLYGLGDEELSRVSYEDSRRSLYPLKAPLAGQIVEKHVTIGELVTPERNLFTIADLSHVWIWIDVYERDLSQVHTEDDVVVRLDAYADRQFEGRVSYLSAQVDVDSRTVRARVDVANTEGLLRPGMFARVSLMDPHTVDPGSRSADQGSRSVSIPQDALQRDGDKAIVFVVKGERRFERREVVIGRRSGGVAEVLQGLESGDIVVVKGAFLLKAESAKETMGEGHSH